MYYLLELRLFWKQIVSPAQIKTYVEKVQAKNEILENYHKTILKRDQSKIKVAWKVK